jgi:hypothetical protein
MRDEDKTREQLLKELIEARKEAEELRGRIASLEALEEQKSTYLGQILVEMGLLTKWQLVTYLESQKTEMEEYKKQHIRRKLIGEILLEAGVITEEQLQKALLTQRLRRQEQFKEL